MTAGFYSPLPPARTGVADYSAVLLEELRRHGDVAISPRQCGVALYHLGNNALHASIYRRALERPGVVVLHDAVLHHFLLGQLSEPAYLDEFVYNYGEWSRDLARDLWRNRASSGSESRYFDFPMLRRIAERARAVVVHNSAAADTVRRHAPQARIVEIPHLFHPPELPSPADILRFRESLGISQAAFLFGVFGFLRESKRIVSVLQAFSQLHRERPGTALLLAGQFVSSDLERAVAPWLTAGGIVRLPYLPESDFWLAASAVDACVNVRYPAAGETSGIAIRLMGIGKPVLLTDGPEIGGFPEDSCLRISHGVAEQDSLRLHMGLLASMRGVALAVGQRAALHIQARHGVVQAAEQYWNVLRQTSA